MITSTNISIKNLAAYCLDYSRLVSGSANLSRGPRTELSQDLVDIKKLTSEESSQGEELSFDFELITCVKHDVNMPEESKTLEQKAAEKRLERDRGILSTLTDINNKLKTQEYTKKIILEAGTVKFSAKRVDNGFFGHARVINSDAPEDIKTALIQIPISAIDIKPQKDIVVVHIIITDPYIKFAIEQLNGFLKQSYYDDIFELITKYDADDKTAIPIDNSVLESVWMKAKTYLTLMEATNISDSLDFSSCTIKLSAKTNYFLAEDLNALANKTDEEMEKTSLGAWSSDEDMNIEYDVCYLGDWETFFKKYDADDSAFLTTTMRLNDFRWMWFRKEYFSQEIEDALAKDGV